MDVPRAFDLVHKISQEQPEEENRVPFSDQEEKPEEPPKKRRPKIELAFFYVLLFIVFVAMGATLISPSFFTDLIKKKPNSQVTPIASNTPQAGFTIEKDGQSTEEAGKALGVGTTPSPTTSTSATPSPSTPSSPVPSNSPSGSTSTASAAKIQILNGTTKEGAAATLRSQLAAKGIVVATIGNFTRQNVQKTTIYYKPEYKTAAQQVQAVSGGVLSETNDGIGSYHIMVIIGATK